MKTLIDPEATAAATPHQGPKAVEIELQVIIVIGRMKVKASSSIRVKPDCFRRWFFKV